MSVLCIHLQENPLEGHGHAHIFCESNLGLGKATGGEITHITIYASIGFSSEDMQALENLKETWGGDDPVVHLLFRGWVAGRTFAPWTLSEARARCWQSREPGSLASPSCPRATTRSRGRACRRWMRAACRSAARSTISCGCWSWRDFRLRRRWSR
ncbi:MAG: CRISPR-associated protein family [Euryarchaeota archaeon]|nr:CRISPR-associated protein family [Euryarchaeota archaeon]